MSSEKKFNVLAAHLAEQLGYAFPLQVLHDLTASFDESDVPNAEYVSRQKALWLLWALEEYYKDSPDKFASVATAGADTVFSFKTQDGWWPLSKLSRLGREMTASEIVQQFEFLWQFVVDLPKQQKVVLSWEIATTIANGGIVTASEIIDLEIKPVDLEIFRAFFWQGVKDGFLLNSNSRMAMIELLIAADAVKTVTIYHKDNPEKKRLVREPNQFLLEQIMKDIISTVPGAAFLGLADHQPTIRGFSTSGGCRVGQTGSELIYAAAR